MGASRFFAITLASLLTLAVGSEAQAQTWTGGYIGGLIGYGTQPADDDEIIVFDTNLDGSFDNNVLTIAGANAFSPGFCGGSTTSPTPQGGCTDDEDGVDFGGRGGYDWQLGRFVVGALGEVSRARLTDSATAFSTTPAFYTFGRELDLLVAGRGRAGYGGERILIYGTAGAVWARLENSFLTSNVVNTFISTDDDASWGYQAGGGVEVRVAERVSVTGEYLYTALRDEDRYTVRAQGPAPATNPFILSNSGGTDFQRTEAFAFSGARVGLNFRF